MIEQRTSSIHHRTASRGTLTWPSLAVRAAVLSIRVRRESRNRLFAHEKGGRCLSTSSEFSTQTFSSSQPFALFRSRDHRPTRGDIDERSMLMSSSSAMASATFSLCSVSLFPASSHADSIVTEETVDTDLHGKHELCYVFG